MNKLKKSFSDEQVKAQAQLVLSIGRRTMEESFKLGEMLVFKKQEKKQRGTWYPFLEEIGLGRHLASRLINAYNRKDRFIEGMSFSELTTNYKPSDSLGPPQEETEDEDDKETEDEDNSPEEEEEDFPDEDELEDEDEYIEEEDDFDTKIKKLESNIEEISKLTTTLNNKITYLNGELNDMEITELKGISSMLTMNNFYSLFSSIKELTHIFGFDLNKQTKKELK